MGIPLEPTAAALGRLARELASCSHPAADAAQDAWLAWLRKPRVGAQLATWLRGARRRGARSILRDEARRREREARVAAAEGVEGPLDSLLRLERARALLAAVESLEEPYRTAVVARFFEELPPRALARRLGIPVNTARSRVRRGLEELRRKLDPESLLALTPLLDAPRRSPIERAGPLVALGLASLIAVFAWRAWRPAPRASLRSAGANVVEALPLRSAPGAAAAGAREALDPAPAETDRGPLPAEVAGPRLTRVSGRLVDERGLPRAGVPVRIEVGSVYVELERQDAVQGLRGVLPVVAHHATSGDDGRFALELVPDPVVGYELWIDQGDFVCVWRELGRLVPAPHELGEIVLRFGATLLGRIVPPDGRPCVGGWFVHLSGEGEAGEELGLSAEVSEPSGEFRFERVPPGRCVVRAESRLQASCEPLELQLFAGETRSVELPYVGPELACRALVVLSSERARMPRLGAEALRWEAGGETRIPVRVEAIANGFLFDALPEGPGTLTLLDERCEPVVLTDARAGRVIELEVRGRAGLRLDVRGADGAPLSAFRATWRPRGVVGVGEVLWDGQVQPGGTVLTGLFSGAGVLAVAADGHAESEQELELLPGEQGYARVELRASLSVQGRVQDEAGRPLAGLEVSVLRPAGRDDSPASPVLRLGLELAGSGLERYRRELARVRSAPDGRFRLALAPGPHVLAILPPESLLPVALSVMVTEDELPTDLVLVLPESSRRR